MKKTILYASLLGLCLPTILPAADSRQNSDFTLPPVNIASDRLSGMSEVKVKNFVFSGNSIFSSEVLSAQVTKFQGRVISAAELQEVRQIITDYYTDAGYVNSGALIPDQAVKNGEIEIQVVEGKLSKVLLDANDTRRLKDKYITTRLKIDNDTPLNTKDLQKRLQILQQNPLIKRFNAELGPGLTRGEAVLNLSITEERPYGYGFSINNHRSPSVGAWRAEAYGHHDNLSGWGDSLSVRYGLTRGLNDYSVDYRLPIPGYETTLELHADSSDSQVVAAPFDQLDIESDSNTYSIGLRHPFYQNYNADDYHFRVFDMSLGLERRRSHTALLGRSFNFSPGVENGMSRVAAIRFGQNWLDRSRDQVIAFSSRFGFGIDALDSTVNETPEGAAQEIPDSRFTTWLGQFRWVKRLSTLDSQLWFRADGQWTNDALLPLEKFAIGGANSVRGYRENQMTRDKGAVVSLEWRIPVAEIPLFKDGQEGDGKLFLVPFADYGWGRNNGGHEEVGPTNSIKSVGLGAIWQINREMKAELFWGHALDDVDPQNDKDLQDNGWHFAFSWQL